MDPAIHRIAARAAPLGERFGPDWQAADSAESLELGRARLDRWKDRVAQGDEDAFRTRLDWLDLPGEDALVRRLGEGSLAQLPDWAGFLADALDRGETRFDEACAHPFGPVFAGFVDAAIEQLPSQWREVFAPPAASRLIDDLFVKLSYLGAPVLQVEFAAFRSAHPGPGTERFDAFCARMAAGGLVTLCEEHAALARLLAITCQQWVGHVGTMAREVAEDREAIAATFGTDADARVEAIEPSLSDAHNHGRSVAIMRFTGGLRLAYKPRSVGIEARWFALLASLDGEAGEFRSLAVLDRGDRGWVEIAEHGPLDDAGQAAAYYRRAGNLLALLYTLEASDCFHENVVAQGAFPVLIDMETLMHPLIRPEDGGSSGASAASGQAQDLLFNSVLRAGLLPVWEAGGDGRVVDISGLGAHAEQVTSYVRRRWRAINTDAMTLHHEAIVVESIHHLPFLDGKPLHVGDHVEPVVEGFEETYRALVERRDALLAPGGGIDAMRGETLRVVFHPTRLYGLMLKRLGAPRSMRCGVDRSIEMEVMARFYLTQPGKRAFRRLLEAERAALERQDIPLFTFAAGSTALPLPDADPIRDAFPRAAIERIADRLRRMDEADLALQSEIVRASLVMASAQAHDPPAFATPAPSRTRPMTRERAQAAASAIGRQLADRAIHAANGSVTWIAPQILANSNRYELRPLRLDLYGGQAGVALFLAALSRVTGEQRDLALSALLPLRRSAQPRTLQSFIDSGHTIGGATGIGSIVYALTRCAQLLDAPDLFEDALATARLIDADAIAGDREHDAMSGSAGTLLGLLPLYEATGDRSVLDRARMCGEHLLATMQDMPGGCGWASGSYPPTTGLSHGASGVALALVRLAAATGDERFGCVADKAIAFESAFIDRDARNWRDLREGAEAPASFMNTWCHGALGIGLTRLALERAGDHQDDIALALSRNIDAPPLAKDGLCCGTMARTELLLATGHGGAALAVAGEVLDRAENAGHFSLSGVAGADFFDPSLYQGLSGIGYQLLRIVEPAQIPSLLTWD
ncbi:type 2 lanthipeptide synthetase LanM family protein [Alteriqipengyuania lutimaris]|uniref:Type 2 lantipeptide synthetase LanM n=1 Tax=Alteriqipengyuania lutimaris TaxID=1538146 RepID=A0A395LKI8_9SPHN|nr:type 2 lanthipeptide synthetase LanM family protein [Alteriqipengyuania lutimaris]MBB3033831.1 type 2 lantibiotic biosynthesis protein LanM [Alteriqipengyuania lutimaris]RDS77199.1 type 2 lantipeptide synthetase LanM [Alteriqipengyuania lutimaris]